MTVCLSEKVNYKNATGIPVTGCIIKNSIITGEKFNYHR
jgi:hypothetical protein